MITINGWSRDYVIDHLGAIAARATILKCLKYDFTMDDGKTRFKSASFTHVIRELRWSRVCKVPGRWGDQQRFFEAMGFEVVKARQEFSYRPGKYRAPCDCLVPTHDFDERTLELIRTLPEREAIAIVARAAKRMEAVNKKEAMKEFDSALRVMDEVRKPRKGIGSY
jgi:hypothetical protein